MVQAVDESRYGRIQRSWLESPLIMVTADEPCGYWVDRTVFRWGVVHSLNISSAVTSSNAERLSHALSAMIGGGDALIVSSRILSTFERKKFAKSVALCDEGAFDRGVVSYRVFNCMVTFDDRAFGSFTCFRPVLDVITLAPHTSQ